MPREDCEFKDRCGRTGHYMEQGRYVRCPCLVREQNKGVLGIFATESPKMDSPMLSLVKKNIVVEGALAGIREHLAGVILNMRARELVVRTIDAYRLVEIFLDQDTDYKTSNDIIDFDLLVIMLGFGDVKNVRLPDLLMQIFHRRELLQKPTWVVLGLPIQQVSGRYSAEVSNIVLDFQRVKV